MCLKDSRCYYSDATIFYVHIAWTGIVILHLKILYSDIITAMQRNNNNVMQYNNKIQQWVIMLQDND